jgi:hypothetical protein
VFNTKNPESVPTFLLDGAVAGHGASKTDGVRLEPFGRIAASTRRELEAEAERLAALHA